MYSKDANGNNIPIAENIDDMTPFMRWSKFAKTRACCSSANEFLGRLMERGSEMRGRTIQMGPLVAELQRNAGLEGVHETLYNIPIGTWPANKRDKTIGAEMMFNGLSGIDGFSNVIFTKALQWSPEDTEEFLATVKRDIRDDSNRKYMDFHVVHGRKPASK